MSPAADPVLEKVKEILKAELRLEAVPDDAKAGDLAEWDSLAYMSIVAHIQDEFGVEATPKNIEAFSSVRGILEEIAKSRGGS